MVTTTQAYQTAIAADAERVVPRLLFDFADPNLKAENITVTASFDTDSRSEQVCDRADLPIIRFASFEGRGFPLDGSVRVFDASDNARIGICSEDVSSDGGNLAYNVTLQVDRTISSAGITIWFDTAGHDGADSFIVAFYNSDELVTTLSASNYEAEVYASAQPIDNYDRVSIGVTKWQTPHRKAKVTRVMFGTSEDFGGDKLISITTKEQINVFESNLSISEITAKFENSDGRFNPFAENSQSRYLRQRIRMRPQLGLLLPSGATEYIDLGYYDLYQYPTSSEEDTASFILRSPLQYMSGTYHPDSYEPISAAALAEKVFTAAGISDYEIDADYYSVSVNQYVTGDHQLNVMLQWVANAVGGYVDVDKSTGKVLLKTLDLSSSPVITLNDDNTVERPGLTQLSLPSGVEIPYYTIAIETEAAELMKETVSPSGQEEYWITYEPAIEVSITVSGGSLVSSSVFLATAKVTVESTGEAEITITGRKLKQNKAVYKYENPNKADNDLSPETLDNQLIADRTQAQAVAELYFAWLSKRVSAQVKWRGDMSIRTGDMAEIPAGKGLIVSNEITYDNGYLSQTTTLRAGE